jgi:3-dehydroquinate synthase
MAGLIHTLAARAGAVSYDILIGSSILPESFLRSEITSSERIALIVSAGTYELHRHYIDDSLEVIRSRLFLIRMDDREENKSYGYAERFLNRFIEEKLNRRSIVIGIGGGVTGDFAGFCAGVYMRGIPIIHVPTTLLAMVDSSIGGKVAVNLSVGKNMVGLFHQPSLVVSDVRFLQTLPDAELGNGLSESFKHGLLGDNRTLELLERYGPDSIKSEEAIAELVALSAAFKTGTVERDEREAGLRSILNFGHTIGHAIESSASYRGISHGQAVAAGIKIKIEVCRRMGLLMEGEAARADGIMKRYGLLPELKNLDIDRVIRHMEFDKKNYAGEINFVLLNGIGNPRINQRISPGLLKEVMVKIC